jgi:hypothetical protein
VIEANDVAGNGVPAGPITITTTGNLIMQAGSAITAVNQTDGGAGGAVKIEVNKLGTGVGTKMVLCGPSGSNDTGSLPLDPGCNGAHALDGAVIDVSNATSTAPAGSIDITVNHAPVGQFLMGGSSGANAGAALRANTFAGQAGSISVYAGEQIVVEPGAVVISKAGSGDSSHGGPVSLVSGCLVLIQGSVSSEGPDPGADRVHLEGCEVHVDGGKVFSQAAAHTGGSGLCPQNHDANAAVCVEIWARHVTIDNGGQVWADFNFQGGTKGGGWVDIYAEQDVNIVGPAIGAPDASGRYLPPSSFAVHSNGFTGDDVGGAITVKAKTSFITMSGRAVSADDYGNHSNGGSIDVEAQGPVTLDGAVLSANGDFAGNQAGGNCPNPGPGNCGSGGQITVHSWGDAVSWQNGVGDARPVNGPAAITIQYCTAFDLTGTTLDNVVNNPAIVPTQVCGSVGIPGYVVFNPNFDWDKCGQSTVAGKKTDSGNNDAGLPGWTIQALDPNSNPANQVVGSAVTDGNGDYVMNVPGGKVLVICEVLQVGWDQTAPGAGTPCPAGPPGYGPNGYTVSTQNLSCCSGVHITGKNFANQQRFSPPTKSGKKFNDVKGDGIEDATDPGLGSWTIVLLDGNTNQVVDVQTTTAGTGAYQFTIATAGFYRVCEVTQAGWTQTYPNASTPLPNPPNDAAKDKAAMTCPANVTLNNVVVPLGAWGWEINVASGDALTGDDFGNHQNEVVCQKPTAINRMNSVFVGNAGPDITVKTWLNQSIQSAVTNATDVNGDGYIIIMVIANSSGALGGSANQSVVISKDYTATPATNLPFGLFGCSVTLTGQGANGAAVEIAATANAKDLAIGSRVSDIFVMDLHGSNNTIGVAAYGNNRWLDNECTGTCGKQANKTGIKVVGNNNTVHNGEATGNTGDGVCVLGDGNLLDTTDATKNGGKGFNVVGNNNTLKVRKVGDKNAGNGGDGITVNGNGNSLTGGGKVLANGGWGINVNGNANTLTKNVVGDSGAGNTAGGIRVNGSGNQLTENTANANIGPGFLAIGGTSGSPNNFVKNNKATQGIDYNLTGYVRNQSGGNQADGVTIPSAAKCSGKFPAQGATTNFAAGTTCS